MEIAFEMVGLPLQILGVFVVLLAQLVFCSRAYIEYRSLKKAFLELTCVQVGFGKKELLEAGLEYVTNISEHKLFRKRKLNFLGTSAVL